MKSRIFAFAFLLLFLSRSGMAQAPTAADVNALKTQIDTLKSDYEKRIQALETQLQELQTQMLQVAPEAGAANATPAAAAGMPSTAGALNPAISVVGNFVGRIDDQKVFNGDGE